MLYSVDISGAGEKRPAMLPRNSGQSGDARHVRGRSEKMVGMWDMDAMRYCYTTASKRFGNRMDHQWPFANVRRNWPIPRNPDESLMRNVDTAATDAKSACGEGREAPTGGRATQDSMGKWKPAYRWTRGPKEESSRWEMPQQTTRFNRPHIPPPRDKALLYTRAVVGFAHILRLTPSAPVCASAVCQVAVEHQVALRLISHLRAKKIVNKYSLATLHCPC